MAIIWVAQLCARARLALQALASLLDITIGPSSSCSTPGLPLRSDSNRFRKLRLRDAGCGPLKAEKPPPFGERLGGALWTISEPPCSLPRRDE